jgi:CpeT/CpcT family (DUF1001)
MISLNSLDISAQIFTLASWLAGDFSNWEQAIENPPFFAHIRVCIRPIPQAISDNGVWLYLEQAYDYMLNNPYRSAVLHLIESGSESRKELNTTEFPIAIINYKLKDPNAYFGAARDSQRLHSLTLDQLDLLCGCDMQVQLSGDRFVGQVEPGKKCAVFRNGKDSYLASEFEVTEHTYSSLDRGNDPVTDERIWGSVAGAFEFSKKVSFAAEVRKV